MMPEIRCPVCSRLQMKGKVGEGTVVEIKCRCRSLLLLTATGVQSDCGWKRTRQAWESQHIDVSIAVVS